MLFFFSKYYLYICASNRRTIRFAVNLLYLDFYLWHWLTGGEKGSALPARGSFIIFCSGYFICELNYGHCSKVHIGVGRFRIKCQSLSTAGGASKFQNNQALTTQPKRTRPLPVQIREKSSPLPLFHRSTFPTPTLPFSPPLLVLQYVRIISSTSVRRPILNVHTYLDGSLMRIVCVYVLYYRSFLVRLKKCRDF